MTKKSIAALMAAAACTGCSVFRPAKQEVMIETFPPGVSVYIDGENHGPSPVTASLTRNHSHTIMAATQGSSYTRELNPKLSTAGTLDIFGAALILVPGVGLLAPGAYDLEMKTIMLHLDTPQGATTMPATP